jgi:hypothetical protein
MQGFLSPVVVTVCPLGVVGLAGLDGLDVFDAAVSGGVVWCVFFVDEGERAVFLDGLKRAAGGGVPALVERGVLEAGLREEFAAAAAGGDDAGALGAFVRWWVGLRGETYHVYRLRVGFGRFRTSCLISLGELDGGVVGGFVEEALGLLEGRRERVLEGFGF